MRQPWEGHALAHRRLPLKPVLPIASSMLDERSIQAIERIGRALARLETGMKTLPAERDGGAELARLREAHQGLRDQVAGAIAQIDRLLEDGESA